MYSRRRTFRVDAFPPRHVRCSRLAMHDVLRALHTLKVATASILIACGGHSRGPLLADCQLSLSTIHSIVVAVEPPFPGIGLAMRCNAFAQHVLLGIRRYHTHRGERCLAEMRRMSIVLRFIFCKCGLLIHLVCFSISYVQENHRPTQHPRRVPQKKCMSKNPSHSLHVRADWKSMENTPSVCFSTLL